MPHSAAHTTTISSAEARAQLAMMLCNARDASLEGFDANELARMYRVKAAEIGQMLAAERERRQEFTRRHASIWGDGHG